MCRNCGALVGAGEETCAQCGMPVGAAAYITQERAPAHMYDREAVRFARAVLSRPYIFTIIFLIANFFVFLLMWHSSGLTTSALWTPPEPVLEAYGAKLNRLINAQPHQWWRFVTPIFIHVGIIHLLVNMYSLWVVGPYVEKLYGSAKFVVFWVVTGVAGVVGSYLTVQPNLHVNSVGRFLFKSMDSPSAGASGALFGLVGVLFVFGIKFRHELPEGFKRAFGTGLLPMIFINLFIGYLGRGFIDNAAHLGGFVSGALLALVVGYKRPGQRAGMAVFWHILQIAALALVAVSFLMVVRHFPRQLPTTETAPISNLPGDDGVSGFIENLDAVNDAQTAFVNALEENNASGLEGAIKTLDHAPRLDDETDALRNSLKALLLRAANVINKPAPRRPAQAGEKEKLVRDFNAWQESYKQWTSAEASKHGVKLQEQKLPEESSPNRK